MTAHEFLDCYNALCYGSDHPTKIYVGMDLFKWLDVLAADKKGEKVYRIRTANGNIPFSDAEVVLCSSMRGMAAHFVNEENPHDPHLNVYIDWTPPRETL